MDHYYNQFLEKVEKVEKPDKLISILSAVAATGLVAYFAARAVNTATKTNDLRFMEGVEKIPTPEGALFYLGHIPKMGSIPAHKITEWHRELGPIIRVKMGVQDWVFISDPITAQDIFAAQGAITSDRPFTTYGFGIYSQGGRGIVFSNYGNRWKNARAAIMNILSPKSIIGFDQVLQREASNSLDLLVAQTKSAGDVDPLSFVQCSSINVILKFSFGMPGITSPEDPLFKEIKYVIETDLYFVSIFCDLSAYLPIFSVLDVILRRERKMKEFNEYRLRPLFRNLVKIARESDQDNLVKKLDLIKDEHELNDEDLLIVMSDLMTAGADTVAITTSWTYAVLCNYPKTQRKLQAEVDAFIKKHGRVPEFEDRLELPYYIAVQKECIRYRPPLYFIIPRTSNQDVTYKNYVIPKGTTMVSNVHTLHTDANIFPEPDKFNPERFLNDTRSMYASGNGNVKNRDQFVFGWGRRMCPGIALAENELFNSITKLVARCNIEPAVGPNGDSVYPDLNSYKDGGGVLLPAPYKVRFVERENRVLNFININK